MDTIISYITGHWDQIIAVVLAVLGAASAIARITPNESDNAVLDWIWKRLNNLGLRGGPTE